MAATPQQGNALISKLTNLLRKIAAKTVTREEGILLLNDLLNKSNDKNEVSLAIIDICETPPPNVYVNTIIHTVSLARNPFLKNVLEWAILQKSEELSVTAAEGLANLGTVEARNILISHLSHDYFHVRLSSAKALISVFGKEGMYDVRKYGISHPDAVYRFTSALVLAKSGRPGIDVLLDVLKTKDLRAVLTSIDALKRSTELMNREDIPLLIISLESGVKYKNTLLLLSLLKLFSLLGEKSVGCLSGYEEYIATLLCHNFEQVRNYAREVLNLIGNTKATALLSAHDAHSLQNRGEAFVQVSF